MSGFGAGAGIGGAVGGAAAAKSAQEEKIRKDMCDAYALVNPNKEVPAMCKELPEAGLYGFLFLVIFLAMVFVVCCSLMSDPWTSRPITRVRSTDGEHDSSTWTGR